MRARGTEEKGREEGKGREGKKGRSTPGKLFQVLRMDSGSGSGEHGIITVQVKVIVQSSKVICM